MKIFLSATSFDESYGGPAYSVPQLGCALAAVGLDIALWAPDGLARLQSAQPGVRSFDGPLDSALASFGRPDIIHDNGIWLPHHHQLARVARRTGIPRVVSPRGMLEPWALAYKRTRKRLAWLAYQRRDLDAAAALHATAPEEAANIKALGLRPPVIVIPNGVAVAPLGPRPPRTHERTRVALFLSRIHPKKGLPTLIDAWRILRPAGWVLHVAGPDEGGHRADIERCIVEADLAERVKLIGPLSGAAKAEAYAMADLFVLPSHSENFGIVVAEALAHGAPVLTTTGTPWQSLLEHDCGWWVEPTRDGIIDGLSHALACDDIRRHEMGLRGQQLMASDYGWGAIADRFVAFYGRVCSPRELLPAGADTR